MHYGIPFQMSLGDNHAEDVFYPNRGDLAPILATPSVPGVYNKFILLLAGKSRMREWEKCMEQEKDTLRKSSNYFRIEFVDWPENMKRPPRRIPKTGDKVCTGDQVRLAVVRENDDMQPTDKNRGFARPMFKSSMGDVNWRASNGTTFTFHYGPVTWRLDEEDKVNVRLINQVEKEKVIPRKSGN